MTEIELREIAKCPLDVQMLVREIRNQESVRTAMYTEHEISESEHLNWIEKLKSDVTQKVFVILKERTEPVGVVSLNAIDGLHKKADWAFYLDQEQRGGLGAAIEYMLIVYAFENCGLEKLNCEVIETNPKVVKMHRKFAFVEEGFRRSNVVKNGIRVGVYFLGLTKEDWEKQKEKIYDSYKSIFEKFTIIFS